METDSPVWFEIMAPKQWSLPMICNSPHSGTLLPKSFLEMSVLHPSQLLMSGDTYVDQLFSGCVDIGAPLFCAHVSRAFLDLNREPYELDARMFDERLPSYMNTTSPRVASGLGTIPKIVGDNLNIYKSTLSIHEAMRRIEDVYRPYHRTLSALLDEAHTATGQALLLDAHSMPSSAARLNGTSGSGLGTSVDIALGDRHGSACDASIVEIAEQCLKSAGLNVRRNKPYAGGYITEIHGKPKLGRHALQIEINRALYMDEITRKPHTGFQKTKQAIDLMIKKMGEAVAEWSQSVITDQAAE